MHSGYWLEENVVKLQEVSWYFLCSSQHRASAICNCHHSQTLNAEEGGGVNQTRLRHDIDEVINKRHGARVSH